MVPCSYIDLLRVLYPANGSLSLEFLTMAIKNMKCRIAFYVYLLLLELATLEKAESHTVAIAQQTIAKNLNVNARTIKRAIAFLTSEGYLIITRKHPKKGGYQLNQIHIRFPEHLTQILLNKMRLLNLLSEEQNDVQANT
jgi:predicted transcriptional regulator